MSNVKNLLGDMDFEQFGEMRERVLEKVDGLDLHAFMEMDCDDISTLYDYWLEVGGRCIASERARTHYKNGFITMEDVENQLQYLLNRFVDWLKSF